MKKAWGVLGLFANIGIVVIVLLAAYGLATGCSNSVVYHKDTGGSSCRVNP